MSVNPKISVLVLSVDQTPVRSVWLVCTFFTPPYISGEEHLKQANTEKLSLNRLSYPDNDTQVAVIKQGEKDVQLSVLKMCYIIFALY